MFAEMISEDEDKSQTEEILEPHSETSVILVEEKKSEEPDVDLNDEDEGGDHLLSKFKHQERNVNQLVKRAQSLIVSEKPQ